MRLENGIGSGKDKKAELRTIASPHRIWEPRLFVTGCLKAEIFEVKELNLLAAFKITSNFS